MTKPIELLDQVHQVDPDPAPAALPVADSDPAPAAPTVLEILSLARVALDAAGGDVEAAARMMAEDVLEFIHSEAQP